MLAKLVQVNRVDNDALYPLRLATPLPHRYFANSRRALRYFFATRLAIASDFSTFKLYRGTSADFLPGGANLVAATTDTGYADPGAAGSYYKLSAVDRNGNESPFAALGPNQTSDVYGGAIPRVLGLAVPMPNPARSASVVTFALPRPGLVGLRAFDVNGRLMEVLTRKRLPAGEHAVSWDLRDAAGDPVPNGLYFLRLEFEGQERVSRLAVVR